MLKKFFSTKLSKVIFLVAVCGLLVFLNPAKIFDPFRSAIKLFLSPFQKIAYIASGKISASREFIFSIGKLKNENEELIKENQRLQSENAQLQDTKRQNEILQEQLDLLPSKKFSLENAYVIGQDPNGFGSWIEISKGSQDGIREGMAVIISRGILVGKVEKVEPNSSQVILVTSPQSVVSVVTAKSGTKGVAKGEFGLGITLDMVLQTDEINEGDQVVTSGIGKNIPQGLFVGTISSIRLSPDKLFQQATINSPVHFSKLGIVSVIKQEN